MSEEKAHLDPLSQLFKTVQRVATTGGRLGVGVVFCITGCGLLYLRMFLDGRILNHMFYK